MADSLKISVKVELGKVKAERSKDYPADDFEVADRAASFAAVDLKDLVLEVLYKAGLSPKPEQGGEDKDVR